MKFSDESNIYGELIMLYQLTVKAIKTDLALNKFITNYLTMDPS